uniref:Uncharacterized protein n=1 Tax=Physcomitrium patens TaxID=3218 RepID=A0A2K1KU68_PHYPA|nr:hypothetical protein PHYPA_004313 [Physcomitrium patens]
MTGIVSLARCNSSISGWPLHSCDALVAAESFANVVDQLFSRDVSSAHSCVEDSSVESRSHIPLS